jgi:hypothetical protein
MARSSSRSAGLHRRGLEQVTGRAEGGKQLAVQVVAVGHHHQRRVLHLRLLQQLARIAGHGDALARTLRVPHHARLARTRLHLFAIGGAFFVHLQQPLSGILRGDHRGAHRFAHQSS